jgi:hypothetical protein
MRADITEIENKSKSFNQVRSWVFMMSNRMDKFGVRMIKKEVING